MDKIVILGASGFIGSNINKYLIDKNFDVQGFSSNSCNLLERSEINKLFSSIENDVSLIICSAITRSTDDSLGSMIANIQMIDNILKEVKNNQLKNIIFMSSVDIYDVINDSKIINEHTPLRPAGYYGLSKLVCEHILNFSIFEIPVTILRLPGIYGNCDNYKSIIGRFVYNAVSQKEICIYNNGNMLRDYVEINDLCEIILHFIINPYNGPVNIVTGVSKSVREVAKIVLKKLNNGSVITQKESASLSTDLVFDNDLIKSLLPKFKFTKLEKGIERYIETL